MREDCRGAPHTFLTPSGGRRLLVFPGGVSNRVRRPLLFDPRADFGFGNTVDLSLRRSVHDYHGGAGPDGNPTAIAECRGHSGPDRSSHHAGANGARQK